MTHTIERADGMTITYENTGAWMETTARGFKTKEEAINWQLDYADAYPIWGYGTMFRLGEDKDAGTYYVHAMRYHSCD